jgi:hypothetical protein
LELELAGEIRPRRTIRHAHPSPFARLRCRGHSRHGLGIGATTSLFTIVRAVLLKPLPFQNPDHLVMVYEHFRSNNNSGDGFNVVSPADFRDWRHQTHGFEDMAACRDYGFDLTGEHAELPEVVAAAGGSWNLFSVLGVQPALGRTFTSEEDQPGAPHVVLLPWSLFQRRFAGDASILGKSIRLDTDSYTVVGVLPRWFNYPDPRMQLWVPYAQTFTLAQYDAHDIHQTRVIARLRPGVSAAAATQEVSALQYRLYRENASKPVAEDAVFRPMIDDVVENVKTPLIVLLCAVGCMLLIACLNVSNLLVARSAARRKEVAVRLALGGTRLTLTREQMIESFLISIAGGALGLALSSLATRWLASHWSALPRADAIHLDPTVLLFSIGLVLFTTLLAGLLPAISSTSRGVSTSLQESSRSIGGSASRTSLHKILLVAEIALTVILLVSAGLFKSFIHLRTSELGCATDRVLTLHTARRRIPLVSGRFFSSQERLTRDHYILISKKFADQFFSGDSPIGKHVNLRWNERPENFEIIGVVGDTLCNVTKPVKATMYFPILSGVPAQTSGATIVVHAAEDPLLLSIPIQLQVAALDPARPVYNVLTMQQILGRSTASQSFSATLVVAFAILSLLLAAIGLYGVLSYLVTQRITEIGIRIALGAQRSQILRLVLLDGLRPVFVGLILGLVGGVGAGLLIRSILYGTSPLDPLVFATMIGSLLLTALAACALPAIRASNIEPIQALRTE